jgi:hypothetical protein
MALFAFLEGVALTQSDGDLFAHIRLGEIILAQGRIPATSVLGFSFGANAVYPAWLAAVWFATLHSIGGLALIVASTAVVAGVAHGATSLLLWRRGIGFRSNVMASLLGLALASSHWLARPHQFSLLFASLLLLLLESDTAWAPVACGLIFLLWANLHGGWAFGLVLVGCYVIGDALEVVRRPADETWRRRLRRDGVLLACAFVATLCTPYRLRLHKAVLATLADRSVATLINEYQPPGLSALPDILFFGVLALSILAILRTRRRPSFPALIAIVVTSAFALRAGRNIAFFGLVAWPLIALHTMRPDAGEEDRRAREAAAQTSRIRAGMIAAPIAAMIVLLGILHGALGGRELIANAVDADRFPTVAVARLRSADIQRRTLTNWTWSGYVPFAWPGQRVFFDPLLFSPAILDQFGRMLLTQAGWRDQLRRSGVDLVILPRGVPLADSLEHDIGWTQWHRDSTATVFLRGEVPADR